MRLRELKRANSEISGLQKLNETYKGIKSSRVKKAQFYKEGRLFDPHQNSLDDIEFDNHRKNEFIQKVVARKGDEFSKFKAKKKATEIADSFDSIFSILGKDSSVKPTLSKDQILQMSKRDFSRRDFSRAIASDEIFQKELGLSNSMRDTAMNTFESRDRGGEGIKQTLKRLSKQRKKDAIYIQNEIMAQKRLSPARKREMELNKRINERALSGMDQKAKSELSNVRFVRIRGRIVPIRNKK
jgi:hypothetical protein